MAPFFLNEFLSFLQVEKRYSEHTLIAYKVDIEQFLEYSNFQNEQDLSNVSSFCIREWMVDLFEKTYSKRTINRKLSSLRSYFKWLYKEKIITNNPIQRISGPKTEKKLPVFARTSDLTEEKMDDFFEEGFEGIRNRLIIELFYQTGIRLSELLNLKKIDIEKDRIKVLGKRNKERIIPISNKLYNLIDAYKKELKAIPKNSECLFVLKNGQKLYPKVVYRIINTYLGLVTSLDKCSPHVLRHTFATHMLNNGAGLETLKDLLGHANLSATQVYTHSSFTQLANIYSQAHPRGQNKK